RLAAPVHHHAAPSWHHTLFSLRFSHLGVSGHTLSHSHTHTLSLSHTHTHTLTHTPSHTHSHTITQFLSLTHTHTPYHTLLLGCGLGGEGCSCTKHTHTKHHT